ncbi:MAG: hypothetical protein R2729_21235 [Bryobacteraceae bacterium]
MTDFEKLGVFYLGQAVEPAANTRGELLLYDSKDLVTHAVCVGMTGSGKTGLCIGLLEEAAIDGIPAIVIDPKGDLANLLLTFPELRPEDFAPWVNPEDAQRKGLSTADYAAQQAQLWKDGLAKWGQDGDRIRRLQNSADFSIYTPGSTAGRPVSILKSFGAPSAELADDREEMRDRVNGTATALLSLVGIDADPVQSREHILIATILDTAWREGRNLDLAALVQQVQTPPVTRIGVLDLEAFYPEKERFKLAMALNNLLASPGFDVWLHGDSLDPASLLYTAEGKPRIAIFSIAHLSDAERMFFVSLLLNQVLSWMRSQPGTTSLRALLYMDEIFGYFPPVANPPSKKPLLTLLKQARAFGVGVVLATQNPVDLDYKGLANCGTWFIGRLQTDRDKQRVLDGLEGAALGQGGKFDRAAMEQTLAGLGNRIFLLNNVHDDRPELFETRWVLSYLRGPMTRTQIKKLMEGRREPETAARPTPVSKASVKPVIPPDIDERFVPIRGSASGSAYQPVICGAASIRFVDTKKGVDECRDVVFVAPVSDGAVAVNWEEAAEAEFSIEELEAAPAEGAAYTDLPAAAAQAKNYKTFQRDFANWLYAAQSYDLYTSPSTSETSRPGEKERDFRIRVQQTAREQRDLAVEKLRHQYASKLKPLEDRLFRAKQAVQKEKQQASSQTMNTVLNVGMSVFGAIFGGGRRGSSVTKVISGARSAGRAYEQRQDVDRAEDTVERIEEQIQAMQADLQSQIDQLAAAPDPLTEPLETTSIKPKKTNIAVKTVGLVWQA